MKIFLVLLLVIAFVFADLPFKNVQGPPEEFDMHKLPSPESAAINSDGAVFSVYLRKDEESIEPSWVGQIPVDSETLFTITLISKQVTNLRLDVVSVTDIHDRVVSSNDLPVPTDVHLSWLGFEAESSVPTKTFEFKKPTRGVWTVKVIDSSNVVPTANAPSLFLAAFNESPDRVSSHLGSYMTHAGGDFTVVASLKHTDTNGQRVVLPHELNAPLIADLDIVTPKGEQFIVTMHDDGNHGDNGPNDGVFAASFSTSEVGTYTAQVVMRGRFDTESGSVSFLRTSQHLVATVAKKLELSKEQAKFAVDMNDEMAEVRIPATIVGDASAVIGTKFKAYAEVWATGDDQQLKAVAFITGMTIAEKVDETHIALPLKMSLKWMSRSNAQLPIVLKNVYVQDVATSVPLSTADEIKTSVTLRHLNRIIESHHDARALLRMNLVSNPLFTFTSLDDETMHFGKRPQHLTKKSRKDNANHKVILTHGYCSSGTPFTTEDFTDYITFLDKKANRDHDTFALMLGEFGKDLDSFTVIGHSQGGPAALHLLTFYWSKQDVAQLPAGQKLIQTVGSPWRGSGLAGSMAGIGSALGFGCGSNNDLTHEGSEKWLATIPVKTRSYVSYYTTQFADGGSCSFGANWVLESPNDGTTEIAYANLDGGNNMGNTKKWCHVTEMNYPAQCHDHERNKIMNQYAKL